MNLKVTNNQYGRLS